MKSELRKQQLAVTLSDNNYLAHVLVLLVVQFLFCYVWNLRAISEYKPQGAYIRRGDLTERFFRYEFGWPIFGGAYFRNFTVCNGD